MRNQMTVVLCAALLAAGCVSQQTYNTEVAKANTLSTANQQLDALNQKLTGELGADQAQITQLQNQLKVTMVNEVLFTEGGWTLSAKGEAALAKIAPTLSKLPGQQIVVEGFTDNVPIGPALKARFPSNWELSSRARYRCAALPGVQGRAGQLHLGAGLWRLPPGGQQQHRRGPGEEPPRRDRHHGRQPALTPCLTDARLQAAMKAKD